MEKQVRSNEIRKKVRKIINKEVRIKKKEKYYGQAYLRTRRCRLASSL